MVLLESFLLADRLQGLELISGVSSMSG